MDSEPERFGRLRDNAKKINLTLKKAFENTNFEICGSELSPVQHIRYNGCSKEETEKHLDALVDKV